MKIPTSKYYHHNFDTFQFNVTNASAPIAKNTSNPQPETASNRSSPRSSPFQHRHLQMDPSQNYHHQQPNFLAQSHFRNLSHRQSGNGLRLLRAFNTRSGIGKNGTKRSRSGLVGGGGMVKISRRRSSGLPRYRLMLVSGFAW